MRKRSSFDLTLLHVQGTTQRNEDPGTTKGRASVSNSAPTFAKSSHFDSATPPHSHHHPPLQPLPNAANFEEEEEDGDSPFSYTNDTSPLHDFVLFRPPTLDPTPSSPSVPPDGLFPDLSSFM
ncbi:hypothetical protein [Absidia glauca]|uniref:Uncharacterized protein n=1 Tax=Absidia glauca TaxID=4829 RepID=A0A168NNQ9_ABSGL|nr:hypothetical protein [Absidia glauca]